MDGEEEGAYSELDDDLCGLGSKVSSVTSKGKSLASDFSSEGVEE